jgi:outer membrane protein TolC
MNDVFRSAGIPAGRRENVGWNPAYVGGVPSPRLKAVPNVLTRGVRAPRLHVALLLAAIGAVHAADAPAALSNPIDLPTTLRLAGAQNLDIKIAREKVAEAEANHTSSRWQFFPWIAPAISYRKHDNRTQDVAGNIVNVHKDSWQYGPTFTAQLDLGDAIYKNLAARQLVRAAQAGLEVQRQDSVLAAAQGYFELARAQSAVQAAEEAVGIADNYSRQLQQAVEIGTAFRGDALRAQVQTERSRQTLRQAHEQSEVAAARLIQTLHLDNATALVARDTELAPIELVPATESRATLVSRALASRPELQQVGAQMDAAKSARDGVKYGSLVPSIGAQVFLGGFGGGRSGIPDHFGKAEDYQFTIGWRVGPGGLFDRGRIGSAEARLRAADFTREKIVSEIARQVTEAHARSQSLADQLATARTVLRTAGEALRLTRERKSFAVGAVLEDIQAQQDFTRARFDFLNAVAEFDKAQYALARAVGGVAEVAPASSR